MRKKYLFFAIFILGLFTSQNVYSEEIRTITYGDSASRRLILWRVYTLSPNPNDRMYITVDSVLKENYCTEEYCNNQKWGLSGVEKIIGNLSSNTHYLLLTTAGCAEYMAEEERCMLYFSKGDYALPDTPENREMLIKKWSETKIIYIEKPQPYIKGIDIDM